MNPITPAASTTSGTTQTGSTAPSNPSAALNENSFLQLMMDQLQHQDPLNSSDPTQYVSELAQFTSLEQQTNTAQAAAQSAASQQTSAALALLGHTVTYIDAKGASQTGAVQKVELSSSGATLTVGGVAGVAPSSVNEVS